MDAAFQKSILIVVLFAVFLGLANYYQYRGAAGSGRRLRYRRRPSASAEPLKDEEEPPRGLLSRWSIWASVIALLLCILALVLMAVATGQGMLSVQ